MLGIRLDQKTEAALDRHAREFGRPKSVIARDWIVECLERESMDEIMRRAAARLASTTTVEELAAAEAEATAVIHMLDEEDGGYDWGPKGPPPVK